MFSSRKKALALHGVDIRVDDKEGGHITIDEHTYVGAYVCMASPGFIKIGKDCMVASHSSLYANNHMFADPELYVRSCLKG